MTNTCRSCSNHHICNTHLPAPIHQTPSSFISVSAITTALQLNMRDTFIIEFFVEDIIDENFLHIVLCDVLFNITVSFNVTLCSLVEKYQCVTKTFASTRTEGQGSRPICNGASLPNYAMLQPTRQWSSLICFLKPKSLRSQTTVCIDNDHRVIHQHLEWHFVSVACEQVHYIKW